MVFRVFVGVVFFTTLYIQDSRFLEFRMDSLSEINPFFGYLGAPRWASRGEKRASTNRD